MRGSNRLLNWTQFEICNPDSKNAFERMCRVLFIQYFFDGKVIPHSNPNNPGIEILPIMNVPSQKLISFQSKYLSSNNYSLIKKSAETTVKHFAGQLDILYLYCNRDLETRSKQYKEIENLLKSNGIDLILISNQTILDQVLQFPRISMYYFEHHSIDRKWFEHHLHESLDALGTRYNNAFNVGTNTERYIDMFALNNDGFRHLNSKIEKALERIDELRNIYKENENYLLKIKKNTRVIRENYNKQCP